MRAAPVSTDRHYSIFGFAGATLTRVRVAVLNDGFELKPAGAARLGYGRLRRNGASGVASRYDLRLPKPAKGMTLSRNRRESDEYRLKILISGTPRADL
jgi:hypothetical protein